MTMPWKKNADELESSAKVVDGNLILSLPDAINPVVWRMELGSVKASALEVKPQGNDGSFMLFLKTPKGEVHEIAPFQTREHAVRALMRVSSALQGAHGKMAPVTVLPSATAPANTQPKIAYDKNGGSAIKWLLTLGGVLVVIFLFAYLSSIAPRGSVESASGESTATNSVTGEADAESGVPQSADQLLRGY